MPKCSKDAVWGAVLCAFTMTAWAGPIDIPVPSASTAAVPPPAYGSPGAGTSSAPVAATAQAAPAAGTAAKPAAAAAAPAPPPKPRPDYSHLDVAALLVQPFGNSDVGHGQKLALSDALSDGAFVILDGARIDSVGEVRHSFDLGVGLHTDGDSVSNFYATLSWTGVGLAPTATPGSSGHGYALVGGVRVMPLPALEMGAELRYDNNKVLAGHTSGQLDLFYGFSHRLWLGLTLGTNSMENAYSLTFRWTFGKQ